MSRAWSPLAVPKAGDTVHLHFMNIKVEAWRLHLHHGYRKANTGLYTPRLVRLHHRTLQCWCLLDLLVWPSRMYCESFQHICPEPLVVALNFPNSHAPLQSTC